jgi:hypothetical protein
MRCIKFGDLVEPAQQLEGRMASFRALRIGLIFISFLSWRAVAKETLYSKILIPTECESDYQRGNQVLAQWVNQGFDLGNRNETISKLDSAMAEYPANHPCRFYFSVGMFEAQALMQQMTTLEYFLEIKYSQEEIANQKLKSVKQLYRTRFQKLGMESDLVESINTDSDLRERALQNLTQRLNSVAEEKNEAVFFGRFVFVGRPFSRLMTLYDYTFDSEGNFKTDSLNQPVLEEGSYSKIAKTNFSQALNVAKEYLQWKPSLFFGEDSLWRGAWWRYFGSPYEKSFQEIKQEGYDKLFLSHITFAKKLRIDTRDYHKIYQLMVDKEKATLNRELNTYEKIYKYRWAPVLVPVGMYAGSAMLVKSSWFLALPAETTSFSFVGGGLASAANASAAMSLLTLSSYSVMGAKAAYTDYQTRRVEGLPFHVTDALDYIVGATYESFPLSAIIPVLVGSSVYSAHESLLAAKSLLSATMSAGQTIQTLGLNGTIQATKSYLIQTPGRLIALPQFLAQKWLESWYKNPKLLLSSYGADILMTLIFDCGYRQVNLEGKDVCVWKDEKGSHFNSQFLYSLNSTVIVGGISKPVTLIPSFGLRWVTYRGVTLLSGVLSQLIVSGAIDSRCLTFDQVYGAGPSSVKGELERYVRMSDWVQSRSVAEQTALIIALRALVLSPIESPIKIYFLDRFIKGKLKPVQDLKNLIKEVAYLSIDDFDDSQVEQALEVLKNEKEVIEAITSSLNTPTRK